MTGVQTCALPIYHTLPALQSPWSPPAGPTRQNADVVNNPTTPLDSTGRAVPRTCAVWEAKWGQKRVKYTRWGMNEENMAK